MRGDYAAVADASKQYRLTFMIVAEWNEIMDMASAEFWDHYFGSDLFCAENLGIMHKNAQKISQNWIFCEKHIHIDCNIFIGIYYILHKLFVNFLNHPKRIVFLSIYRAFAAFPA